MNCSKFFRAYKKALWTTPPHPTVAIAGATQEGCPKLFHGSLLDSTGRGVFVGSPSLVGQYTQEVGYAEGLVQKSDQRLRSRCLSCNQTASFQLYTLSETNPSLCRTSNIMGTILHAPFYSSLFSHTTESLSSSRVGFVMPYAASYVCSLRVVPGSLLLCCCSLCYRPP